MEKYSGLNNIQHKYYRIHYLDNDLCWLFEFSIKILNIDFKKFYNNSFDSKNYMQLIRQIDSVNSRFTFVNKKINPKFFDESTEKINNA